jgi:prepilin-type N-terminal cleavage/methylation domain-containing protein
MPNCIMKNPFKKNRPGFTLLELLVAMTITTIIVTVLISITAIAVDVWNRSRSELRAARQAKSMVDTMARDLESLVVRIGNNYQWLTAETDRPENSSNAARLIFYTAATDRYEGELGTARDEGGDVSCVGYQLDWEDPLYSGGTQKFETFVLYRRLVDPKPVFVNLLGKEDLVQAFDSLGGRMQADENFVCENIYQFTITFHVDIPSKTSPPGPPEQRRLVIQPSGGKSEFRVTGNGIVTLPAEEELRAAKLKSVGISLTVLSDSAIDQLRKRPVLKDDAAWLTKNSFQYSKQVHLPGM